MYELVTELGLSTLRTWNDGELLDGWPAFHPHRQHQRPVHY